MNALLKIAFMLCFLGFFLGQIGRIQLNSDVSITLLDVFVGVVVLLWVISLISKNNLRKSYLLQPILIFAGIGLISLAFNSAHLKSQEFLVSLLYLIRWIFYALIFFIVSGFDLYFKKKMLNAMFLSGTFVIFLGYVQYFFYPSLRNLFYLGWDEHLYRMFSVFLDPNFAGSFFVLFFFFILGAHSYIKISKNIYYASLLFTLVAILLSFSRSAFIMLLLGFFIFFGLKKRWKLILIFFVLIISIIIISSNSNMEGMNLLRVASTSARIDSMKDAAYVIQQNPLFGVGFNAYRYSQERYGLRTFKNEFVDHAGAGTDNSFLFILATTGIIGFVSYVYIWWLVVKKAYQYFLKSNSTISLLVITSIISLSVNSLFINSQFYTFNMFWVWCLVGLMENNEL